MMQKDAANMNNFVYFTNEMETKPPNPIRKALRPKQVRLFGVVPKTSWNQSI